MQLALNETEWDIYLDRTGNLATLGIKHFGKLLCQRIKHRLQTFQGECFLDRRVGVPYFSEVLKKNPDLSRIRSLLASVISSVEGVVKILSLEVLFDQAERHLSVEFKAQGADGTIAEGEV